MLQWFRKGPSPYQTSLAMVGVKGGDRVMLAGAPEPELAAQLARLTGLNGQTVAANQPTVSRAAIEAAAAAEGVLVEFADAPPEQLPADEGVIDIVVLAVPRAATSDPAWRSLLNEGFRALRPGGRLIVIEGIRKSGLFGASSAPPPTDTVSSQLLSAGGRASRLLASAEGLTYYEAQKPR
ncbi:MAG: methyltransferase domain-containing protein [Acidobacteriota bacterium]